MVCIIKIVVIIGHSQHRLITILICNGYKQAAVMGNYLRTKIKVQYHILSVLMCSAFGCMICELDARMNYLDWSWHWRTFEAWHQQHNSMQPNSQMEGNGVIAYFANISVRASCILSPIVIASFSISIIIF